MCSLPHFLGKVKERREKEIRRKGSTHCEMGHYPPAPSSPERKPRQERLFVGCQSESKFVVRRLFTDNSSLREKETTPQRPNRTAARQLAYGFEARTQHQLSSSRQKQNKKDKGKNLAPQFHAHQQNRLLIAALLKEPGRKHS